ncbi:MAG TPA: PQQ-dependent sugar dehydrogenase [Kofleriaceae bacterium]|nr:PQQ-dependent sugar dehydrogenase [Kofleriaceae bacterium]
MKVAIWVLMVAIAGCSQPSREQQNGPGNGASVEPPATTNPASDGSPESGAVPVTTPAVAADGDPPGSAELIRVPPAISDAVELRRVMRGFDRPIALEVAPGDPSGRLFVVEQPGRVWAMRDFERAKTASLDLRGKLSGGMEQGLLGLAFHPRFPDNGKAYVNYTDKRGTTRVVEYQVKGDRFDPASAREVFMQEQPFSNHNAGDLEFAPDGTLYIGLGDGGAGGDPLDAGQSDDKLLGKMLRLNVDDPAAKPEIVLKGLRNPWRYAFDPKTKDFYIGDVGQNLWEEIHVLPAGRVEGNLGWNIMEGSHCFQPKSGCKREGLILPAVEYSHKEGCSVTGGEVYRGKAIPALDGAYFYADFCKPFIIRSFRWSAKNGARDHWDWTKALNARATVTDISSFGVDAAGELYVISLAGDIFKLVPK